MKWYLDLYKEGELIKTYIEEDKDNIINRYLKVIPNADEDDYKFARECSNSGNRSWGTSFGAKDNGEFIYEVEVGVLD